MSDDKPGGEKTAAEFGAEGGRARARRLTREQRREISKRAAEARWGAQGRLKVLRATHEGALTIASVVIPCAVLEDGTRVLSRAGFLKAIGRKGKAKGGRRYDLESKVPVFLTAENVKPFVPEDLVANSDPIPFRPLSGASLGLAMGYKYQLLPQVCHVFIDAKEAGVLHSNQLHIAEQCRILSRGFSIVGLAALIDEATGYQNVSDREKLESILNAYLGKELAAWAKRFPDDFYRQIFRLRGWQWRGRSTNPPQVVGKYTDMIVYQRLAPDLVENLRRLNPKNENGHRPSRHHQWLTADVGHPALAQHVHAAVAIMRTCTPWAEFVARFNLAFPKRLPEDWLPFAED